MSTTRTQHDEELAHRGARRVAAQLRELAIQAARSGLDPLEFLAGFERSIREERRRLSDGTAEGSPEGTPAALPERRADREAG